MRTLNASSRTPRTIALPTPYPVGRVNVYLLRGPVTTLLDVGVRSSRSAKELEAGLGAEGVAVGALEQILLTHAHFDHAGAAPDLAERSGAGIRCHADAVHDEAEGRRAFLELLARFGAPPELSEQLGIVWQWGDRFGVPLAGAKGLEPIADGERVRAGELELEAIATPGHAPGHLCYLARAEGLLFCGDLLLANITPNPLPHLDPEAPRGRRPSLRLYLESLDRVEALGPCRGLPGHGPPLEDTVEALRTGRSHVLRRADEVLRLMANNPGRSLHDLAGLLFGETTPLGQALAFCEVLAHADRLEDEGLIALDPARGIPTVLT